MTIHMFAIEDGHYLEDEDPRAAWLVGHLGHCLSLEMMDGRFPHACTCGHESLRVLAVPGPVGCDVVRAVEDVTDGWKARVDLDTGQRCHALLHDSGAQHILFTNNRGDEVVVDRGMLWGDQ